VGLEPVYDFSQHPINEKASKGYKTPSEAFKLASFGNPLSWLSPSKLRVESD
jgi:hypothetical protein